MKNLKNLLDGSKLKSDIQFKKLCINSNDIDPGDIFVALKNSSKRDGNKYIDHAFDKGAVAILSGIHHANDNRNIIHVSGLEEKLVHLANKAYAFNQVKKIFGITGTNGKTSTIHFLKQLHEQLNMKVSFFNSIENGGSGLELRSSNMTTPDIFKLYRFLEISSEHNIENCLLEVSSHAIHQKRIGDIEIKFKGLTSFSEDSLLDIGLSNLSEQVIRLTRLAKNSGLDGVVCAASDTKFVKTEFGKDFLTVTPGIRPSGSKLDDQSRVSTPLEAIRNGSDYLVIGRPITGSSEPKKALEEIYKEIS